MNEIIVHILHTSLVKENYDFITSILDIKRIEKAEKYLNEKDRLLSMGAGFLLKKYLLSEEIKENEQGKPYVENGPHFNLSHSGEYVVLAVHSEFDIGVDIQKIDENKAKAIKSTLSGLDTSINDLESLFRVWSNKESIIKCLSSNMNDIKKVNGLPFEGERIVKNHKIYVKSMVFCGYSLSVSVNNPEPFDIKIHELDKID